MIPLTYRIEYKLGDTIKIKPIFDVHLGSTACDVQAFKAYLADSDKNTYFLGGGDLFDSIVVPDKRYSKSDDSTEGNAIIDQQVKKGIEILRPYKKKIIGLGLGNHERTVIQKCGTNPIQRICEELNVPQLGYSGLLRLSMRQKKGGGRTVIIRYHHGWGGGSRTQGADLTKYSKDIAYWEADVFLYGHVHRKQTDIVPRLGLSGDRLISRPKILCICGTYLKTYTRTSDPTYSEVCGYPPTMLGGVVVEIKPVRYWVDMRAYIS